MDGDNERMFDADSFASLQNESEVKQAVDYLAHNEIGFKSELTSEGLSYEKVQIEVRQIWLSLLKLCDKFKYSNYVTVAKKVFYGIK